MTIVAVQCRIGSTRLAEKALLPLDNKPLISWTLDAMKKVPADEYWLACDHTSLEKLNPIAHACGWNCFAGSENDVLERFCQLAEKTSADIIVRATGDNPFLFYEVATASITEFKNHNCDYFTFTGLPHGSGIELLSATAILKARTLTTNPYDHEHVGPAIYNHKHHFTAIFKPAPKNWTNSTLSTPNDYRTTIDTLTDYRKACRIVRYLNSQNKTAPYTSTDILEALSVPQVNTPILLVPAIGEGRGTGHLRRCLSIAEHASAQKPLALSIDILIQPNPSAEATQLIEHNIEENREENRLQKNQFLTDLPQKGEYAFIITDTFNLDKSLSQKFSTLSPLIAIDEGNPHTKYIDYLLDIIPPSKIKRNINLFAPNLIPQPKKRRGTVHSIKKILISIGGEDPSGFTTPIFTALKTAFRDGSVQIDAPAIGTIPNLKEKLHEYDLVITHYGFTAFEATTAGCALILLETSPIHKKLAKLYNCICLSISQCTPKRFKTLCATPENLMPRTLNAILQQTIRASERALARSPRSVSHRCGLSATIPDARELVSECLPQTASNTDIHSFITDITHSKRYTCPLCGENAQINTVISRDPVKTIRQCKKCNMLYIAFCRASDKQYAQSYFFEEYKKQYGKTYLEDFDAIKTHGLRRMQHITNLLQTTKNPPATAFKNTILDIGCAFGPFLCAAQECDWTPYGTDIAQDAISYVRDILKICVTAAPFPNFNPSRAFGTNCPPNATFDAVTMWYVIEHFQNLDTVLKSVANLVKIGGVFAFSTPNAKGITARFNTAHFFTQSPNDHFTLWEPSHTSSILSKYGFRVKKIVSTGHHSERFPPLLRRLPPRILATISRLFCLGDTFEVYCIKKETQ